MIQQTKLRSVLPLHIFLYRPTHKNHVQDGKLGEKKKVTYTGSVFLIKTLIRVKIKTLTTQE